MNPTYSIFRSKTFWSVILMFIVGGGNAIVPVIPPDFQIFLQAILALAASYFHKLTAVNNGATN